MAHIKQIKLNSTDTPYDIWALADADGNTISTTYTKKNQAIPYIVGSSDDTQGVWTGTNSSITAYENGLTIIYVPAVDSSIDPEVETTLKINNLAAIPCTTSNLGNEESHYYRNSPILFTYKDGEWISWESSIAEILNDVIFELSGNFESINGTFDAIDSRLQDIEGNSITSVTLEELLQEVDRRIGVAGEELTETIPEIVLDQLNTNGLTIQKDEFSVKTTIDENGLVVEQADGNLIAQFTNENSQINHLEVTEFFTLIHHKVESVQSTEYDGTLTNGTGFFYNG